MSDRSDQQPGIDPNAPPPIVHGRPVEIADGVFIVPDGRVPLVPNIGVIVGDRAALVVESGLGPKSSSIACGIAKGLAGDRPLYLTLTHFHPEHGFGAQAFRDATIVYNRAQHEEFLRKRDGYLAQFRGLGAAVADQLDGVAFVDPHVVYDGGADLDLGGKLAQLRTWDPAHTRGDQTVYLPNERILFTGDLVENRFYPIFPFIPPYDADLDANNWIAHRQQWRAPGHESPRRRTPHRRSMRRADPSYPSQSSRRNSSNVSPVAKIVGYVPRLCVPQVARVMIGEGGAPLALDKLAMRSLLPGLHPAGAFESGQDSRRLGHTATLQVHPGRLEQASHSRVDR